VTLGFIDRGKSRDLTVTNFYLGYLQMMSPIIYQGDLYADAPHTDEYVLGHILGRPGTGGMSLVPQGKRIKTPVHYWLYSSQGQVDCE
jgi:hypothetical protein